MPSNQERIRELRAMMSANSRKNNEIFRQTKRLDSHLLYENIRMREELGRLSSAKNMDVGALA